MAAAAASAAAKSKDARPLLQPDVIGAWAVLQRADLPNFDHLRQRAREAGASLASLDKLIEQERSQQVLSHSDAADLAIEKLGGLDSLKYSRGQWWLWRGDLGMWRRIESDETIKQAVHSVLPRRQINASTVGSIFAVLRTRVSTEVAFVRAPADNVINCANGELHLRDVSFAEGLRSGFWELKPHRRESFLTSRVPHPYDESAQCPTFLRFLEQITEGDEDAEQKMQTILEAIGYSLTTSTRHEKFFLLYGPSSSNGKSTLLAIIEDLVGKDNTAALSITQLGERFALADLDSRLVNLCAEVARSETLPDAAIKKLSSGDAITVERKGRDHFEIRPYATLWFATNNLPSLRDLSPATLEKRCIVLTLNRRFEGELRDTGLRERLRAEAPGILNLCANLYGAKAVLSRGAHTWAASGGSLVPVGFNDCLLTDPPSSIIAKAEWRKDSDPVTLFVSDRLVPGRDYLTTSADMFKAWTVWAEANGISLQLSQRQLTHRLKGVIPSLETGDGVRENGKRVIRGVALVPHD